jgi:OmcA/MtrC family decaheme c-type cytochrome
VLSAFADLDLEQQAGEHDAYRFATQSRAVDLRFGSAAMDEPYALISSPSNCNACHGELYFHGETYRGFDACIACHGDAGAEDRPRYVAANAPDTSGVTINFRTLLHQIHRGEELANADFEVCGAGSAPYPDNFSVRDFDAVLFPALPGRTAHCAKCHGAGNTAWTSPAPRDHPTEQGAPSRPWRAACGTCHDSAAALAHIELRTTPGGAEACDVCHGPGAQNEVELAHKTR